MTRHTPQSLIAFRDRDIVAFVASCNEKPRDAAPKCALADYLMEKDEERYKSVISGLCWCAAMDKWPERWEDWGEPCWSWSCDPSIRMSRHYRITASLRNRMPKSWRYHLNQSFDESPLEIVEWLGSVLEESDWPTLPPA